MNTASKARVSILIPAYNERHFGAAFSSALAQTHRDFEVVVCDDSPGTAIEQTVRAANDPRVRYVRNPQRLGFEGNFTECLRQSSGELVKFLNDDDRLRPQCVEALAAAFEFDPRITLVTSRRVVIDAEGKPGGDVFATTPLSHVSCLVPGMEMGDFNLANSTNLIGEPTTVMFRRADVMPEAGGIFTWHGRSYHCLADMALWLRLLAKGHAFYHATPLSEFRMHAGQEQRGAAMDVACVEERGQLVRAARAAGFLQHPGLYRMALSRIEDLASRWLTVEGLDPAHKARLADLRSEVQREMAPL